MKAFESILMAYFFLSNLLLASKTSPKVPRPSVFMIVKSSMLTFLLVPGVPEVEVVSIDVVDYVFCYNDIHMTLSCLYKSGCVHMHL